MKNNGKLLYNAGIVSATIGLILLLPTLAYLAMYAWGAFPAVNEDRANALGFTGLIGFVFTVFGGIFFWGDE